jgi:hypothetical protein
VVTALCEGRSQPHTSTAKPNEIPKIVTRLTRDINKTGDINKVVDDSRSAGSAQNFVVQLWFTVGSVADGEPVSRPDFSRAKQAARTAGWPTCMLALHGSVGAAGY